jgi:dihydroflavonol-4-reductase
MTNLVTGANGFVGAALVRRLLAGGETVRALVRKGSNTTNLNGIEVDIHYGDVRDRASLNSALAGCRFVFHAAADYRLWVPDVHTMYATNVDGSVNVLECAAERQIEKMIYTSSVAVLGINADRSPADENTPVVLADMIGPYKRSKFIAEQALRTRALELGFPLVTVNPSTPIGPRDIKPTPTGKVILDAALGRIPAFVDTGLNVVHVDDVADGHLRARDHGRLGERYVLGGVDMSLEQILRCVAELAGRRPPRIRLPRAVVYPAALIGELIAKFSGVEPRVTLDGLRMSKKHMYFSSLKAQTELGYQWREPSLAIHDALDWFNSNEYLN